MREKRGMRALSLFAFIAAMLVLPAAYAFQPRLDFLRESSILQPHILEDPKIARVYYDDIEGAPAYYKMTLVRPIDLHLTMLVPYIKGEEHPPMSLSLMDAQGKELASISEYNQSQWEVYYEPIIGDFFYKGPSVDIHLENGGYLLKVYNSKNTGRFALNVGDVQYLPPGEIINALILMPLVKWFYFDKPLPLMLALIVGAMMVALALGIMFQCLLMSLKTNVAGYAESVRKTAYALLWAGLPVFLVTWGIILLGNTANILALINTFIVGVICINVFVLYKTFGEHIKLPRRSRYNFYFHIGLNAVCWIVFLLNLFAMML